MEPMIADGKSCTARHLANGLLEVTSYDDFLNGDAMESRYATIYLYRVELVKKTRRLCWLQEMFNEQPDSHSGNP